jgi:hypothetical protein
MAIARPDVATRYNPAMGFNKRKMEDARRQEAEKEAAARRATDRQILEDAEQLVIAWNERQAKRMPMLFSPTIGAISAGEAPFTCSPCQVNASLVIAAAELMSLPPI